MADTQEHIKLTVTAHLCPKEYNFFFLFSYIKYLAITLDACKLISFLKQSLGQKSYSACFGQQFLKQFKGNFQRNSSTLPSHKQEACFPSKWPCVYHPSFEPLSLGQGFQKQAGSRGNAFRVTAYPPTLAKANNLHFWKAKPKSLPKVNNVSHDTGQQKPLSPFPSVVPIQIPSVY